VRGVQISQGKAYTAARLGVHNDAFLKRLHEQDIQVSDFCDDKLTAMPDGAALRNAQGKLLGGIGVSGLAPDEVRPDRLCAGR
jgi:glc operon protein GlcG